MLKYLPQISNFNFYRKIKFLILRSSLRAILLISSPILLCMTKCAAFYYKLVKLYDWYACPNVPNYFKHLISLYNWRFDPKCNQFCTGPAIARSYLRPNDRVLDVCCGDGSASYLFFSDIASHIDAVDWSSEAISYAKINFGRSNISHHNISIFDYISPAANYDLVYFGSGMDYFSRSERELLFKKLNSLMHVKATLVLKTPLVDACYISNQQEMKGDFIHSEDQLFAELSNYFGRINISQLHYCDRKEFIAICSS